MFAPEMAPKCARWPQDRSKSSLGCSSWAALGPLLALLKAILGRREAIWGGLLGDLEAILGRLGANLGRLGAILGRSWAPKKAGFCEGAAVGRSRVAPPRDFLRKFLRSRDLDITTIIRDVHGSFTTRVPCCAGGGGSRTPCGRRPPPPRRDVPITGCARQLL